VTTEQFEEMMNVLKEIRDALLPAAPVPTTPHPVFGYTCPSCWVWVPYTTSHRCGGVVPP
jgi:hypothetical protein